MPFFQIFLPLIKYYDSDVTEILKSADDRFGKFKVGYCHGKLIRYRSLEGLKRQDGANVILFHTDIDYGENTKSAIR